MEFTNQITYLSTSLGKDRYSLHLNSLRSANDGGDDPLILLLLILLFPELLIEEE
jgi:hypothetical protein